MVEVDHDSAARSDGLTAALADEEASRGSPARDVAAEESSVVVEPGRGLAAFDGGSPETEREEEDPAPLWLRRGDQTFVAILVALGLVFLSVHAWRLGVLTGDAVDVERLPQTANRYRLQVNRATWVEWSQLDGIGETLARRITADREANGPFRSLEDLSRVKGLGPKTLEKIAPWLTFHE